MAHIELQPRIDEGAGPKPVLLVGEYRLQPSRAGALVDQIVDQLKLPLSELHAIVLVVNHDCGQPAPDRIAHLRQILLWKGEDHRNRVELCNDDKSAGIAGMHDVALIDQTNTRPAIER